MTSMEGVGARTERSAESLSWFNGKIMLLMIGAACSLLAVDARWDIPIAAWFAPVFILRFSRITGMSAAIAGVVGVSALQIATYILEMGAPFSATAITLCLILGITFSVPFLLDRIFGGRLGPLGRVFLLPVAATMIEFGAASILPVGASIGTRAITQTENLALMQVISILGPYAIGFLIALAATIANHIWENPSRVQMVRYGGTFAVLMFLIVVFGEARLTYASNLPASETVKVAGIIPRMDLHGPAWSVSPESFPPSKDELANLASPRMKALYAKLHDELLADTQAAASAGAKIILWSETAAPVLDVDKDALLQSVANLARSEGVYVNAAIGVHYERNETFLIGPDGRQHWHYRKNYPVPGMEPVAPFRNAAPVLETPFGRLTNVICYDADFPALARVPADIMLLPGMDTPDMGYVHTMRMARLRAIENGYSLIRIDYNGVSAAFDPFGRVLGMLNTSSGKAYTMIVDLPVKGIFTLYSQTGDLFAWLCLIATIGLCAMSILRPISQTHGSQTDLSAAAT